jgi:hypothetical protein
MAFLVRASLLVVGVVHLLPLVGALGHRRLEMLYGLPFDEPNLAILMRHRAVLFGLLGAFSCVAAFRAELRAAAFVAGFASLASFLALAATTRPYNARIARVVAVDVAALALLCLGAVALAMTNQDT